ncbi:hypothetical protein JQC92_01685 [Shewanella sp. 202IG2-18]|uniref:hypothetical protein n=1 Tax=Parashewanella hymeniacidonis TaxID=2807618 RepID=UPI001960E26B|nr:hypothetical protein [Parashewanella hymeniacidonis]MBM7070754.1 hypothetical protein [Parashewanella hymeniacidonis]
MSSFSPLRQVKDWFLFHKGNGGVSKLHIEFLRLQYFDDQFWVEYKFNTSSKTYNEPLGIVAEMMKSYQVTKKQYETFQHYLSLNSLYCGVFQFLPNRLKQKYVDYALSD